MHRQMRYPSSVDSMTTDCAPKTNDCGYACHFREEEVAMPNRTVVLSLALTISMALVIRIAGQGTSELQLVTRAADALGGRDRVMVGLTMCLSSAVT